MWAYQLTKPGQLKRTEREQSAVGSSEVLVKLKSASLNARDASIFNGHFPNHYPLIPLSDGAGVVSRVGNNVEQFSVGDKVTSCFYRSWENGAANFDNHRFSLGCEIDGVLSEYFCVPESALVPMPEHLSFSEAATLPCAALTAWSALFTKGKLTAGQHVLILGTGGVAIFALQFAKLIGAKVTITSSNNEKLGKAKKMGADNIINYVTHPQWSEQISALTDGLGVDLIIELGGAATLNQSLKCIKVGGKISVIGAITGVDAAISVRDILFRHVQLNGITVGHRQDFIAMNTALSHTGIKPIIEQNYTIEQTGLAFEQMIQGGHFGKLVIDIEK